MTIEEKELSIVPFSERRMDEARLNHRSAQGFVGHLLSNVQFSFPHVHVAMSKSPSALLGRRQVDLPSVWTPRVHRQRCANLVHWLPRSSRRTSVDHLSRPSHLRSRQTDRWPWSISRRRKKREITIWEMNTPHPCRRPMMLNPENQS